MQNYEQEFIGCFSEKETKLFSRLFIVGGGGGEENNKTTQWLLSSYYSLDHILSICSF